MHTAIRTDRQIVTQAGTHAHRQTDRLIDRQTDGQTDRQTDRQTDTQIDRHTPRQRDRRTQTDKQTQTNTETDRQTENQSDGCKQRERKPKQQYNIIYEPKNLFSVNWLFSCNTAEESPIDQHVLYKMQRVTPGRKQRDRKRGKQSEGVRE